MAARNSMKYRMYRKMYKIEYRDFESDEPQDEAFAVAHSSGNSEWKVIDDCNIEAYDYTENTEVEDRNFFQKL